MKYFLILALCCCLCECKDRPDGIDLSDGYPYDPVDPGPVHPDPVLPPITKGAQ